MFDEDEKQYTKDELSQGLHLFDDASYQPVTTKAASVEQPQDEITSLINTIYGNKLNPTQAAKIKQMAADPNYLKMMRNQAFAKNNPGFDVNAGKQETYDKRWEAYQKELFNSKKRINTKRAQRVFNEQFEQDWNANADQRRNEYLQKRSQLVERPKPSIPIPAMPNLKPEKLNTPALTLTPPKPKTDWNAKAVAGMGEGTTMADVENWQKYYNQINKNKKGFIALAEDGMFGENTKTAYDAWKNSTAGKQYETMTAKGATWDGTSWKMPKDNPKSAIMTVDGQQYSVNPDMFIGADSEGLIGIKSENKAPASPATPSIEDSPTVPTFEGDDSYAFEYTMQNAFDKLYNNYLNSKYTNKYGGLDQNNLRKDGGYQAAWDKFRSQYQKGNIWLNGLNNRYTKLANGGNINKFSNGGKQMNEQEMQKAFVQFLIQDAQAQGIPMESEQDMQNYLQQLGEKGIEAKKQEFLKRWKGTPSKKLGGYLNQLHRMKGNCPDGYETLYMEDGGRVCPKCVKKAEKASGGSKLPKNEIDKFKERKHINPSDTVHVNGQPRTLTDSQNKPFVKGMKPYSAAEYQKDMKDAKKGKKDAANRVEKSDMKTAYGCGNKLVKRKKK